MKINRKTLSDPSSKMLVYEQTVDIKRKRRALENSLSVSETEKKLIDVLLEIESRQSWTANEMPMHANLVESLLGSESGRSAVVVVVSPLDREGMSFILEYNARFTVIMGIWRNDVSIYSIASLLGPLVLLSRPLLGQVLDRILLG
ncbi:hypothetical protein J1N35_000030 [Gossypium stocksii]|uniref:Uncharacterized protein n=1 Tax=Gossypium stocksii TaxID=47602 RepID=A0A9D3WEZ0_9ROSI|nr:hypothetical protein J1N35_000030 [Gossypium stocksii]